MPDPVGIHTIGHSTRSFEALVALLRAHGITWLVDVRAHPGSRRFPHFDRDRLAAELPAAGIGYTHVPELGGRRRPRADSPNRAWRNEAFRGYADHMQTPAFASGLDRLLALATAGRVAIMCAEAVPWQCHRWLIADALVARGVRVLHITGAGPPHSHALSAHARVIQTQVSYPADDLFGR
jgi:uncharacterized protein (DUF488 family)